MDSAKLGVTPQKSSKGVFWGCAGCLGLAIVPIVAFSIWSGTRDPSESNDNGPTASVACENAVRQNLKSPSTASFTSQGRDTGDLEWEVTGTVDSQNSFGATVRAEFACSVAINDAGATATLLYLNE